jgi:hypothetical protein
MAKMSTICREQGFTAEDRRLKSSIRISDAAGPQIGLVQEIKDVTSRVEPT